MIVNSNLYMDYYKSGNGAFYEKPKWITQMNGVHGGGQMKKWNKVHLLPRKGQGETPINKIGYKRLSLGNVQTHDGIFETTHKL